MSGGAGTVEDVLVQFLGKDSLTSVSKDVEKSLQGVQKQADNLSKSLAQADKTAGQFGKGLESGNRGMDNFGRNLQSSGRNVNNFQRQMEQLQWTFMDFGLIMGGMTLASVWDKFIMPAAQLEDQKSTLVFMGESEKAVTKFMDQTMEYAAQASKVAATDLTRAWQLIRIQTKMSAKDMANYNGVLGDTVAQFIANGRDASAAGMAMSDAMAGQFRRMYEIGIKEETLMKTGLWDGTVEDAKGFMEALKKIYKDRGLTGFATKVTSTMDRIQMASEKVNLAFLKLGETTLPFLTSLLDKFIGLLDSGAGPIIAWVTLIGMLALAFIFLAPFILSTMQLMGLLGGESVTLAELNAVHGLSVYELSSAYALFGAVMTEVTVIEGRYTLLSGAVIESNVGMRASFMGLMSSLIPLLVVIAALYVAWETYNYFATKSDEIMKANHQTITNSQTRIYDLRQTYLDLQQAMKDGQTSVYDKETGKWITIQEAVKKAGDEYKTTKTNMQQAYTEMIQEQAGWESAGKAFTGGMPVMNGRKTTLGKMAEYGTNPFISGLFGAAPISQEQSIRINEASNVLQDGEDWKSWDKFYKNVPGATKIPKGEKLEKAKNDWNKKQDSITDEKLSELGFDTEESKKGLLDSWNAAKKLDDAYNKLGNSANKLMTALADLINLLLTGKKTKKDDTGATDDTTQAIDSMSQALGNVAIFLEGVIGFVTWLTGSIDALTSSVQNAVNWLFNLSGTITGMPEYTPPGQTTWNVGNNSPGITNAVNTANKNNAKGTGTNVNGLNMNQLVNTNQQTGTNIQVPTMIAKNSPLALYDKSGRGKPYIRFPQFTPKFVKGMENFSKNRMNIGSKGGGVVVHHHNEQYTIDASHMNEKQLMGLLYSLYSNMQKPTKEFKREGVTA